MERNELIDMIIAVANDQSYNVGVLEGEKWNHYKYDGVPDDERRQRHMDGEAPLSIRCAFGPDKTRLAAMDFDLKPGDDITVEAFRNKVLEVKAALEKRKLYPLMFESRGGAGINMWMRWDGEQSVRDVRGAMLMALEDCGLTEGKGHVANGEVELFPTEWYAEEGSTPLCLALPMFGERRHLSDGFHPVPLPKKWKRCGKPAEYSHTEPDVEVDLPDSLYDADAVAGALAFVPHNDDVEVWHKIGYALKRAFHDVGFDIWDQWSSDSKHYEGTDSMRRYWDRKLKLKKVTKPVTIGTIIHLARKNGWEPPPTALRIQFTDLGMARFLAHQYADSIRWCSTTGQWYVYSGSLWRIDEGCVQVRRRLTSVIGSIQNTARELMKRGDKTGEAMMKFAREYQNATSAARAIKSAEALAEITIRLDEFDADASRVLAKNDVVIHFLPDEPWIEIEENSPDHYFTKMLGVPVIKDARRPDQFINWLREMMPDDEVLYFVKRICGAMLGGHGNTVKRVPFLYGETGDNGKTALAKTIRRVFGDYGGMANPEMFADNGRGNDPSRPRSDLMALRGLRFVMMPEVSSQSHLDEATFRNFTGGEYRSARQLHQQQVEWEPLEMYWLAGNSKPRITSNLSATFNRIALIEIDWSCPPDRQREEFDRELVDQEGAGILTWMVQGWIDYRRYGREIPEAMRHWVDQYQREEDAVHHFKDQCMTPDKDARTPLSELWAAFEKWHFDKFRKEPVYKSRTLKTRLENYGVEFANPAKHGTEARGWRLGKPTEIKGASDWLEAYVKAKLDPDSVIDSNPKGSLAATTILKDCEVLEIAVPVSDVKELGGELARCFSIHGVDGDAPGLTIMYLDDGFEFHRQETDNGFRYFIQSPDSDAY